MQQCSSEAEPASRAPEGLGGLRVGHTDRALGPIHKTCYHTVLPITVTWL